MPESAQKLMSFADVLTGHLPGGLAQVNVLPQYADGRRVRFGQRRRGHAV